MNRIAEIGGQGQSIWYDYIQRGMIWTGALHRMVQEDGLKGVTSNPAIFEKAIAGSKDYGPAVRALVLTGAGPLEIFERIAVQDIQLAADVLRPAYEQSGGVDGYVSLEVSPHLAHDTEGTFQEARRLWRLVARDNLMVKIPATPAGVPAIERAIAEGINVNVTLLFAVEAYEAVAQAYLSGLERLVARGGQPGRVASVASFFVSRIDTLVDKLLDERLAKGSAGELRGKIEGLKGKVAVANAKLAYQSYLALCASPRWQRLAQAGARPQRLLWASTGTKNPAYRDVVYVEELIGKDTVNTVPEATYLAFKDHGRVAPTLAAGADEARRVVAALPEVDVSLEQVTGKLLDEGVVLFADAFDRLLAAVERKRREVLGAEVPALSAALPGPVAKGVEQALETARQAGVTRRLWQKDPSLWSSRPEDRPAISGFMGWLGVVDQMIARPEVVEPVRAAVQQDKVEQVVLMGMGGSSLAPEVFARTLGRRPGWPELLVLDSTVPAQVASLERRVRFDSAMFIVASKSGSTTEPLVFDKYFFDRARRPDRFIAITDPGSKLEAMARARGFRAIVHGDPEVGGRYSALSPFGLAALAAMGLDVPALLLRARRMVASSGPEVPPADNAGVRLGLTLGRLALEGRDKLTLVASPALSAFGAWLEQLIAESTGKLGKGIVPVDLEPLASPELYGSDRCFAYLALKGDAGRPEIEARLAALEEAGHPVLRVELAEREDLVQEMFRWEVATAVAGHALGINPFDQPNVQESKDYTARLLAGFAEKGALPPIPGETKLWEGGGLALFTDAANAAALGRPASLAEALGKHLDRAGTGDYVGLNAYVEMTAEHEALLTELRLRVRARRRVATTVGFGPRFLHSTGQLHKGGTNSGVFLQLTCTDGQEVAIPGEKFGFSVLKAAQEAGDFMALSQRQRRLLRVHLGIDVRQGLRALIAAL